MAQRLRTDWILFSTVVLMVLFGALMIYSASSVVADIRMGSSYYFALRQLIWIAIAIPLMMFMKRLHYRRLQTPAVAFTAMGLVVILLAAVYFADPKQHRWIRFGPFGGLQPSEFAKPAIIFFLAWFLSSKLQEGKPTFMDDWRNTLLPAIAPTSVFLALIVFQPDLGTPIACAGITACILFVAGIRLRYFGYALAASILPLYFLIFHVAYRRDRILAFLNPYADPQGRGFHMIQSLIAVSTGGITGLGLMEGRQKLFYLPEPQTDFIFAVTAEELGLVGSLAVIILFAIFLWRGTRVALRTSDPFGRFLAVGITSMITLQAFINISVVLGLMPTKGIPLPFVSYGGSSLFVTLACVGVLLNITKQAE